MSSPIIERLKNIPDSVVITLIYLFFLAGAAWNTLGVLQDIMRPMTPFVLIASAIFAVWKTYQYSRG
ncbi:MAG: hypothetical protein KFH87_03380, partial [Bacteroidetes bacterium]|nr:hypothetical protein [Bacteroidota bacterium]